MKLGNTGNAQGEKYTKIDNNNPNVKIPITEVSTSESPNLRSSASPFNADTTAESNSFHCKPEPVFFAIKYPS